MAKKQEIYLPEDRKSATPVFYNKKQIGYIYRCYLGYGAVSFNSEIGHEGAKNKKEAEKDVRDLWISNKRYEEYLEGEQYVKGHC